MKIFMFLLIFAVTFASNSAKNKPKECLQKVLTGLCSKWNIRFAYIPGKGCRQFRWKGCGRNKNNFKTYDECEEKCGNDIAPECFKKVLHGFCVYPDYPDVAKKRYAYVRGKGCQEFMWKGCQWNENHFETFKECKKKCGSIYVNELLDREH